MAIEQLISAYYGALRNEEPLEDFFVSEPEPVKFGINETLSGYEEIVEGLREQTQTTTDWEITSHGLQTGHEGDVGWFSDHVTMAWHDREQGEDVTWETRWSGTLVRSDGQWRFVRMHVSAAADD